MIGEKLRSLQHCRASLAEIERALQDSSKKIGELALLTLGSILQHPDFPEEVLESFRKASYSRRVFGLSYPLLIRKREWTKASQYYANYLCCRGKYYCLSSAWFEFHRARLIRWVRKHKIDIDERRSEWQMANAFSRLAQASTTQQAWLFDFGRACRKTPQTCLIEMRIPKKLIEVLATQNRKCIFQGTLDNQILLFRIDALTLDREFWRDMSYYTNNKLDNRWRFYLNVLNGNLYSRFGSQRIKFGHCSRREVNTRLCVSKVYETYYKGENQTARPVGPVCASRAEKLLKIQANSPKNQTKESQNNKKNRVNVLHAFFEQKKQSNLQTKPLKIQITNNDERQYIKILDVDVSNRERMCRFVTKASNTVWEISSKLLVDGLKAKRIAPIIFFNEGTFWTFYIDGQTGKIYKLPSDTNAIMQLKRAGSPLSPK